MPFQYSEILAKILEFLIDRGIILSRGEITMRYLSIDIETTGLTPENCDILQFAAVIDDLKHPKPLDELPKFEAIILKRDGYQGHPYALSMHSNIFKKIDMAIKKNFEICPITGVRFLEICELPQALEVFLLSNGFEQSHGRIYVNVAGKNIGQFDLPFLNAKIKDWGSIKFLSRVIDPAILYFDIQKDISLPDMKSCLERAGLAEEVPHTALEDALIVVKLLRKKLLEEKCVAEEKNSQEEKLLECVQEDSRQKIKSRKNKR